MSPYSKSEVFNPNDPEDIKREYKGHVVLVQRYPYAADICIDGYSVTTHISVTHLGHQQLWDLARQIIDAEWSKTDTDVNRAITSFQLNELRRKRAKWLRFGQEAK